MTTKVESWMCKQIILCMSQYHLIVNFWKIFKKKNLETQFSHCYIQKQMTWYMKQNRSLFNVRQVCTTVKWLWRDLEDGLDLVPFTSILNVSKKINKNVFLFQLLFFVTGNERSKIIDWRKTSQYLRYFTCIADKARWDHYAPKRFATILGGSVMMECQVCYVTNTF